MREPEPAPDQPLPTRNMAQRLVIAVIGSTVILAGVAMLVLPGPGIATILVGLAVLGTEFVWARRLLHRMKERGGEWARKAGIGKPTEAPKPKSEDPKGPASAP